MFGGTQGSDYSIAGQFKVQVGAALITTIYTLIASFVILKAVDATIGLRVSEQQELSGLDLALHSEVGYNMND